MKLLSFIVLLFIFDIHKVLGQNEEEPESLVEKVTKLQEQVSFLFKHLNISNGESYKRPSEQEISYMPCFKEKYLSERAEMGRKLMNTSAIPAAREELRPYNFSSQYEDDLIEMWSTAVNKKAILSAASNMFHQLNSWRAQRNILNASYVEQKLKDFENEKGQITYEFLRRDHNECLELFKMDLSEKVAPDTASRIISLYRMMYGNRTEIETALSYLYGSKIHFQPSVLPAATKT